MNNQSAIDLLIEGYNHCLRLGVKFLYLKHGFNNAINYLRAEISHVMTIEQATGLEYVDD